MALEFGSLVKVSDPAQAHALLENAFPSTALSPLALAVDPHAKTRSFHDKLQAKVEGLQTAVAHILTVFSSCTWADIRESTFTSLLQKLLVVRSECAASQIEKLLEQSSSLSSGVATVKLMAKHHSHYLKAKAHARVVSDDLRGTIADTRKFLEYMGVQSHFTFDLLYVVCALSRRG